MPETRATPERDRTPAHNCACGRLVPPRSMTAREWIFWRFVEQVTPRLPRLILSCALGGALLLSAVRRGEGLLVAAMRAVADALR